MKMKLFIISVTIINESIFRSNNQDINICNCIFSVFYSGVYKGGAIYLNGGYFLHINETTFYKCININEAGGAIWVENSLDSYLYRICATYCKATWYQFAIIQTQSEKKNLIAFMTISKCYNESIGFTTICLGFGIQNITNSNISHNKNIYISGFAHYSPYYMYTIYSNFFNNTVSEYTCIQFYINSGTVAKTNIIMNNSPINYGVVFLREGFYSLNECIFQNNFNMLIFVDSGSLLIENSNSNQEYLIFGTVINTLNIYLTNTFLNSYYNSNFCDFQSNIISILSLIGLYKYQPKIFQIFLLFVIHSI